MFNSPINNFHISINALIVFIVLILIIVNFKGKNVNKSIKLLRPLSCCVFLTCLFSTLALLFTKQSDIFFVISFMLIDWVCYTLVFFTKNYNKEEETKITDKVVLITLIIDNIILFIGMILYRVSGNSLIINFELRYIDEFYSLSTVVLTPYFVFHMCLAYIQIFISLVYLIRRIIVEPKVYRIKYTGLILSLIFIITINLIFLLNDQVYDYSYFLYGVHLMLIYYSLSNRRQNELVGRITSLVLNNLDDKMIIYSIDNYPIYVNKAFKSFFNEDYEKEHEDFVKKYFNDNRDLTLYIEKDDKEFIFTAIMEDFIDEQDRLQARYILFHDITNDILLNEQQNYQDTHDSLTNIFNLTYFFSNSKEYIKKKNSRLIISNFKSFKSLNRVLGENIGDSILVSFAEALKEVATRNELLYARAHDDKFVFIANDNYLNIIKELKERLSEIDSIFHIEHSSQLTFVVCDIEKDILASFNNAMLTFSYEDNDDEIKYYSLDILNKVKRKDTLLKDFDNALKTKEIILYFQPQINTSDNTIFGIEVLARWIHHDFGLVNPGEFIPLFEKYGLIHLFDEYIWEEACLFLVSLKDTKYKDINISINISPIDFYLIDVPTIINNLIKKYNITTKQLRLEITESAFVSDDERIVSDILKLRNSGFIIEMDDFGSAYSSLNALKSIPLDILKLDLAFISGTLNTKTLIIIKAIIDMTHNLGFPVIAEGVESIEIVQMLNNLGCNIIQGYYFSRPIPKNDLLLFLDNYTFTNISSIHDKYNSSLTHSYPYLDSIYKNKKELYFILKKMYKDGKLIDAYFFYSNKERYVFFNYNINDYIGRTIRQIYQNHEERIIQVLKTFEDGKEITVERTDFGFHFNGKIEFLSDLVIIEMKEVK